VAEVQRKGDDSDDRDDCEGRYQEGFAAVLQHVVGESRFAR